MKSEFMAAITQLSSEKGVPKEMVVEAIEAALVSAYKRNFETPAQNLTTEIEGESGAVKIFRHQLVVDELQEERPDGVPIDDQITLEEARAVDPKIDLGDTLTTDITPPSFGRIAAQTAKQVVLQKLREAERRMVFDEFAEREGEIVHGIIQRIEAGTAIIELGRAEAIMPRAEQVPS